jgi:hypothetical protein
MADTLPPPMATATLSNRAPGPPAPLGPSSFDRALGHRLAFVLTALILLTLFGWTFFSHPDRVAPTKDPAYYTWRTEALMSEKPAALLSITGPFDVFSGGYRVSAAVLGGYLRRIAAVSELETTVLLVVALPVLTALLLGGFAYRQRADPLIFHAVALGSGSLLLTPPFVGYLDNMLCLFFISAALWFIPPSRGSWPARAGLGAFLLIAGFTHPTTLAIFGFALGGMALVRLLATGLDLRRTLRLDGPVLAVALVSATATYLAWKIGIWGRPASLSEAALPPPYGSSFFLDRTILWLKTMHPLLNGPLFIIGLGGLVAAGRRAAEDDLARIAVVWLLPLAGLFGFVGGLTYPYYRFFNTTLAWLLLVGIGGWFAMRFFVATAARGGIATVALLGVVAVVVIIGANFAFGLGASGWSDPNAGWLTTSEKRDLDALRSYLTRLGQPDRPVVFVTDNKPPAPFQIYGFTKLTGNTSRYGLPPGQIDRGFLYLGSFARFARSAPTLTGDSTYDRLSQGFLEDARRGIASSGRKPLVVLDAAFNVSGSNERLQGARLHMRGADVVEVSDGRVTALGGPAPFTTHRTNLQAPIWHIGVVVLGLILLLLPGLLAIKWFLPDALLPDMLGMVPALSMALLSLVGIVVLALTRSPFSGSTAWLCVALCLVLAALLRMRAWNSIPRNRATYGRNLY